MGKRTSVLPFVFFVTLALSDPAHAGIADTPLPTFSDNKPSLLVMSVPGVVKRDRLQTDFICTSLESSPIDIGVEVFASDGTRMNDVHTGAGAILNVNPGQTVTIGTGATATYLESKVISLTNVSQGSGRVLATSNRVRCNVMLVDNFVTPPVSLATLGEGVRPAPGAVPATIPLPTFADNQPATHAALFPGAVKRGDVENAFFCTSLASGNIDVGVEVLDSAGAVANSINAGNGAVVAVAPGATVTFATTATAALLETALITIPPVAQGLARMVSSSAQVMCAALVLDAVGTPPKAMSTLVGAGAGNSGAGAMFNVSLPQFSDGKQSVHVMTVPGVVKRNRLQTDFMCTSVDAGLVDIGVEIFGADGLPLNSVSAGVGAILNVGPGHTVTIGTSATAAYSESAVIPLATGMQGTARIVASSDQVRCNVMLVDDFETPPVSLATLGQGVQPVLGAAPSTRPLPQFSNGHQATHAAYVPGLVKRGDAETDIFCTSLATGPIDIGVEVFRPDGTAASSIAAGNGAALGVSPGEMVTIGTTGTAAFFETAVISLTGIAQGMARIVSNSAQLICTAMTLDASVTPPAAMSALTVSTISQGSSTTPTVTPSPAFTRSVTPTPTATRTATPTPSATVTPPRTATATPIPTTTPSSTSTRSSTPTATVTRTSTHTTTATPTHTLTGVSTATGTSTIAATSTATRTPTVTATWTPTRTGAATAARSLTATATPTHTSTPSATRSTTPTATVSHTPTTLPPATATATHTKSSTATHTILPRVSTVTASPTETSTHTPVASTTSTHSPTVGPRSTPTVTATPTIGDTPTATPSRPVTPSPTPDQTSTVTVRRCAGDCSGDGRTSIDELVRGVGIALGKMPVTQCLSFDTHPDGRVTIDELVAAVKVALNGCGPH